MGQEFHVVRCFSCESFQVQQVKKVKKWACKMCGEKQSLMKEFGRGSGADCRRHVQKLNSMRGAMMEEQAARSLWTETAETEDEVHTDNQCLQEVESHEKVSRWSKYLDTPAVKEEEEEEEDENVLMDRQRLQANNRTDRKRKRACGGGDSWTREQSNCSRQSTTAEQPSVDGPTNPTRTRPPHPHKHQPTIPQQPRPTSPQNHQTSSLRREKPPNSLSSGSRWSAFLSPTCQLEDGDEPSEEIQEVGGAVSPSTGRGLPMPVTKPRPLLPVSSMFESGNDFNFDDMF